MEEDVVESKERMSMTGKSTTELLQQGRATWSEMQQKKQAWQEREAIQKQKEEAAVDSFETVPGKIVIGSIFVLAILFTVGTAKSILGGIGWFILSFFICMLVIGVPYVLIDEKYFKPKRLEVYQEKKAKQGSTADEDDIAALKNEYDILAAAEEVCWLVQNVPQAYLNDTALKELEAIALTNPNLAVKDILTVYEVRATKEPAVTQAAQENKQPAAVGNNSVVNQITLTDLKSPKSKWLAFILCLLLGWLGFHRFYVGKVGTGLIYMFSLGLCGVGVLIDLVVILLGGFKDCNGRML